MLNWLCRLISLPISGNWWRSSTFKWHWPTATCKSEKVRKIFFGRFYEFLLQINRQWTSEEATKAGRWWNQLDGLSPLPGHLRLDRRACHWISRHCDGRANRIHLRRPATQDSKVIEAAGKRKMFCCRLIDNFVIAEQSRDFYRGGNSRSRVDRAGNSHLLVGPIAALQWSRDHGHGSEHRLVYRSDHQSWWLRVHSHDKQELAQVKIARLARLLRRWSKP